MRMVWALATLVCSRVRSHGPVGVPACAHVSAPGLPRCISPHALPPAHVCPHFQPHSSRLSLINVYLDRPSLLCCPKAWPLSLPLASFSCLSQPQPSPGARGCPGCGQRSKRVWHLSRPTLVCYPKYMTRLLPLSRHGAAAPLPRCTWTPWLWAQRQGGGAWGLHCWGPRSSWQPGGLGVARERGGNGRAPGVA